MTGLNHGSYSTYVNHGCRCDLCRAANREKQAKLVERRAAVRMLIGGRLVSTSPRAIHGLASTYRNYVCRCQLCTSANSRDVARFRAARAGA